MATRHRRHSDLKEKIDARPGSPTLRDPAKPIEHYQASIALLELRIQSALKSGAPVMFRSIADYYLRICRAAYSAGYDVTESMTYLAEAAKFQIRFFTEAIKPKLLGLDQIEEYLEGFSGAYLVGQAVPVIDAFERVKPDNLTLWEKGIMDQFCSVLTGKAIVQRKEENDLIKKMKEYANLPALFKSISDRDSVTFAQALDGFLMTSWGPSADRAAKHDLKSEHPIYTGKWSIFSAAMCRIIACVPDLSKKAAQYVPIELVKV
jgi:hypothetical protein